MRKKLFVPEIIIFLLILGGGIFMFGMWKSTRLDFLAAKTQLKELNTENERLNDKIGQEVVKYDSLRQISGIIADSLKVMKVELKRAEMSYKRLAGAHRVAIDSLEQLHDTLMVEMLLAQVDYIFDQRDTSFLVPMPVIRIAVIKIEQGEHCMVEKEALTDMYEGVKQQVNVLEQSGRVKDMMLISAETMLHDKDKVIDLKIKEGELYKKEIKRQKLLKIIFIGISAVIGGIAIAK